MEAANPMERSLHPKGLVVTLHPTKKEKVYETDIQSFIILYFQDKQVLQRRNQHKQRCKVKTSSFHKCFRVASRCRVVGCSKVDSGCQANENTS